MQIVKLSATVERQLAREYNAAALKQINTAIESCIVAIVCRMIRRVTQNSVLFWLGADR
jgi:hypothetical protein